MMGEGVPSIGVDTLHERLAAGADVQVVDVREEWEWATGHISGALHIPLNDLPARMAEIDSGRDVAFICHLGGRSDMATRFGLSHGLSRALNVPGGMDAWTARGYRVE